MKSVARFLGIGSLAAAGTLILAPSGLAAGAAHAQAGGVVFAQTDATDGNAVVAYDRAADGTLTRAGTYATGGDGGVLDGSVVDHLASQGSLAFTPRHHNLLVTNAGSDTITRFAVRGDRLQRRQRLWTHGTFPVSITTHGRLVYVLNALDGGSVQGYHWKRGRLVALRGSHRDLGLDPNAQPQFTNTPGQIAFARHGRALLVTTKANGSDIDVFGVGPSGRPSRHPTVNDESGAVPFAISFDPSGRPVVAEAGTNSVVTFNLARDGILTPVGSAATGQSATCWVTSVGRHVYVSNAGSASVSGFSVASDGQLTSLGNTTTDAGTVDSAATTNGRYLYVETGGAGVIDEFAVGHDGSLTSIGSVTLPNGIGAEGIVAR